MEEMSSLLREDPSINSSPSSDGRPPPRRRGSSRTPSFSSSTSSLCDSPSSFAPSPSPSPFHRFLPSSAVPFSWERQPGIPKSPSSAASVAGIRCAGSLLLPLPPSIRSAALPPRKKRWNAGEDPFAVALAQCAKLSPPPTGDGLHALCVPPPASSSSNSIGNRRRPTIVDRIRLVGLYASCKTSCSVSETTVVVSRSTLRAARPYGLLSHQTD